MVQLNRYRLHVIFENGRIWNMHVAALDSEAALTLIDPGTFATVIVLTLVEHHCVPCKAGTVCKVLENLP